MLNGSSEKIKIFTDGCDHDIRWGLGPVVARLCFEHVGPRAPSPRYEHVELGRGPAAPRPPLLRDGDLVLHHGAHRDIQYIN